MKKLTLKDMTAAQQMRVKTRLGQERKKLGRELTNAELNKAKDQIISEISKEIEQAANKIKAQKEKINYHQATRLLTGQQKIIAVDFVNVLDGDLA